MKDRLAKAFALYSSDGALFTFWKGRVALYCFLKSLHLKPGDEVILPGLTCVVVPNAIIYAGLVPIYVDVNVDSFNMDPSKIEEKITNRTRVIVIQNTFGLSSDVEKIVALSKRYALITIDDCTHGYGGTYNIKPNGSLADAAFYSSQWNKPFSTVIGGYLVVNNLQLIESVKKEYLKYKLPTVSDNIKLFCLFHIKRWLINQWTYWPLLTLYRWLSQYDFILGSSQKDELLDVKKPNNYEKKMSFFQQTKAIKEIGKLSERLKLRRKNAKIITSWLIKNQKIHVKESYHCNHSWLKYPILVKNRRLFFEEAAKKKVPLGDWFISPIHPVQRYYHRWFFDLGSCQNSVQLSNHLVNLPTDTKNIEMVIKFLEKMKGHLL